MVRPNKRKKNIMTSTLTANLSWATLTAVSNEAVKFWLRYIAGVWMSATHGSEEDAVESAYQNALESIGKLRIHDYSDPSDGQVQMLYMAFAKLVKELTSIDSNPVDLTCVIENDHGKNLKLGWSGAWTRGRYVNVTYCPRDYPKVFVQWDTGTGEESRFLSLPSKALQFLENDEKAKIYPLANHYRLACEQLGIIDVTDIPRLGYEGVRTAEQALKDLVADAIQAAAQNIRKDGGYLYE